MSLLLVKHGGNAKKNACIKAGKYGDLCIIDDDIDFPIKAKEIHVQNLDVKTIAIELKKQQVTPTAVLTFVDPAIVLASEIADQFSLPCLKISSAETIKNKYKMRVCTANNGVRYPRFEIISDSCPIETAVEKIGYPCVLKPIAGAFSLGIIKIDSPDQLKIVMDKASIELSSSQFQKFFPPNTPQGWIIEEYLDGIEISVELLGHPEKPQVIAVHEKVINENGGHFREDRFITAPWRLSEGSILEIEKEAINAAKALGFTRGIAHIEMRVTSKGVVLLELQACPAGGLISLMVEHSTGVSLHELHVKAFLQKEQMPVTFKKTGKICVMDFLCSESSGYFNITGIEKAEQCEGVMEIDISTRNGKVTTPYAEYLGCICCSGSDAKTAIKNIDTALKEININVKPFKNE